jgi:hypothetical protein
VGGNHGADRGEGHVRRSNRRCEHPSGGRTVWRPVYTNRTTDVREKFFVRVDVTEEFPFLVTKLSLYFLTLAC